MAPELHLGLTTTAAETAAVAIDDRGRLRGAATVPSDGGVRAGMAAAIAALLAGSGVDARRVTRATLASTELRTALTERRIARPVAVIRVGAPMTLALPPLGTWPGELRRAVSAGETVVRGGAEYDGRIETPLDTEEIDRFLETVGEVDRVAVTGVFSPVVPEQEHACAEAVRRALGPSVHVSMSHEIGSLGLIERENATVVNAALVDAVSELAIALADALADGGVAAEPYFAQNDGTLMALEHALRFPVLMIGAGPATGMRGAAHLTGIDEAVVVDAGGGSTEVGSIANGFPRESRMPTEIAGVRMDLLSSDVRSLSALPGAGDALAGAVDRAAGDLISPAVIAVGSASALVSGGLAGVHEVIRPADGAVAGAIGVTVAPVSGRADRICPNRPQERREALAAAGAAAFARAIHAGADPAAVELIDVQEVPLTYLAEPAVHIRVKAAGPRP